MNAWKPPTARSSASALPSRSGISLSSSSAGRRGGSATRSIRRTIAAASMRPPASRNAWASSRCIVEAESPQNSADRSFT